MLLRRSAWSRSGCIIMRSMRINERESRTRDCWKRKGVWSEKFGNPGRALQATLCAPLDEQEVAMYCENVKNVTVSLDEQTYRRARVAAAERGTSLSALVRAFLEELGSSETESERLKKSERVLRERIAEFRAGDRLTREQLHERRGP